MTENDFWEIIETGRTVSGSTETLRDILSQRGLAEIVEFHNILGRKLCEACLFNLLAANFLIVSYVSDDGFLDFRAWLIANGFLRYRDAIANAETIANWLCPEEIDNIDGSAVLSAAELAYLQAGGDENEFISKTIWPPDPKLIMDWPETKAQFRLRFPKLVDRFWNQDRIQELHPE